MAKIEFSDGVLIGSWGEFDVAQSLKNQYICGAVSSNWPDYAAGIAEGFLRKQCGYVGERLNDRAPELEPLYELVREWATKNVTKDFFRGLKQDNKISKSPLTPPTFWNRLWRFITG